MKVNLFVDALANYLLAECDQVLKTQDGANKITLVVQSFPLAETVAVLKKVDDFFVKSYPGTLRALKISLGLWNSWSAAEKKALDWTEQTVQQWVDVQDQLVTFRNEGHCIFFGFDHASEKGSLKDFHLVNEDLLWTRVLTARFNNWVDQCADHLDDSDEAGQQHLLAFLESVDKFNPRNLSRTSRFLCSVLAETSDNLRDVVRACYSRLPEWSAMPLVDVSVGRNLPRLNRLVDSAHRFSTHAMFTSRAEREKAVGKIDKAQVGAEPYPQFDLPAPVQSDATDYSNAADYLGDVRLFIRDNDAGALERLKRWDATALLLLLEKPERKKPGETAKSITLKGYSDVVFLQAIQIALGDLVEHDTSGDDVATIDEVKIQLRRYTSDGKEPLHEICTLLQGIVGEVIPEILTLGDGGHDVKVVLEGLEDIVIPSRLSGLSL